MVKIVLGDRIADELRIRVITIRNANLTGYHLTKDASGRRGSPSKPRLPAKKKVYSRRGRSHSIMITNRKKKAMNHGSSNPALFLRCLKFLTWAGEKGNPQAWLAKGCRHTPIGLLSEAKRA